MMPIAPRPRPRPTCAVAQRLAQRSAAMKSHRSASAPALRLVDAESQADGDVRDPSPNGVRDAEADEDVDVDVGAEFGDELDLDLEEEALAAAAERAAAGELDAASEDALRRWLQRRLSAYLKPGHRARIIFTDNVHTMLSVKRGQGVYTLRMHRMFAAAPPAVLRAVARYAQSQDREAGVLLRRYIDGNEHLIRDAERPRSQQLDTQGAHFNLQELFDGLNARYFGGTIEAKITWGRGPAASPGASRSSSAATPSRSGSSASTRCSTPPTSRASSSSGSSTMRCFTRCTTCRSSTAAGSITRPSSAAQRRSSTATPRRCCGSGRRCTSCSTASGRGGRGPPRGSLRAPVNRPARRQARQERDDAGPLRVSCSPYVEPSFPTRQGCPRVPREGPPWQDPGRPDQAAHDPARPVARVLAGGRRAVHGDLQGPGRGLQVHGPRQPGGRSSPTAPRCSASATSARWRASR